MGTVSRSGRADRLPLPTMPDAQEGGKDGMANLRKIASAVLPSV